MTRRSRSNLLAGLALPALVCLAAQPALAQPAAATMSFDIPAGSLDGALQAFLSQSNLQLIYDARAVRGLSTAAVRGRLSPEEVLARLLEGSGLAYIQRRPGVFVLKPRGSLSPASLSINGPPALAVTASDGPPIQTQAPLVPRVVDQVDEIVVTGSLIRGGGSGASPVVTLSRDDIDRSGRATVAEMLSDLPQNFGGMASEDSNLVNSDRSGANAGVATGVNLRGMGSSATLVLVNGRRLAGSGLKGDFADVSAIPTAAVERIEVLLDGASALYGSDAVGGVVNIILKTDFNGAETRARLGAAQGGGAKERQIAQTIGKTWSSGHALLFFLPSGGATPLVLLRYGGNPDLKPETAKSWTAGIDYAPERLPDLKISLGWFDTRFTHQIGAPVFDDIYNVLGNRAYAPFIQPLNPATPSDLAKVEPIIAQSSSLAGAGLYPANAYTAIVDGRNVNTGGLHIQGLDFHAQYGWRLPRGRLDLGGDATYLLTYARKVTPTSPWLSLVDTVGQPVDLRARGTAAWSDGPWSLSLGLNYVDDYATAAGTPIDSWTTADLQAQWRAPPSSGFARGLSLLVSVRNLFNTDPPFYDSPQAVGYDAANADPLGRMAAIQLTKRW